MALSVALQDDATFDNFYLASNQEVIVALRDFIGSDQEQFFYCWGEPGSGLSHCCQAACHDINAVGASFYIDLSKRSGKVPEMLEGMETMQLVCLDNIQSVLGKIEWEEAIFHFYNRAKDSGTKVMMTANVPPMRLSCDLRDLQSRLGWGLIYQLKGMTDLEKMSALSMRAKRRGFELNEEVLKYIFRRSSRNMKDLIALLDKLDHVSLEKQRRITVPFVKEIFDERSF